LPISRSREDRWTGPGCRGTLPVVIRRDEGLKRSSQSGRSSFRRSGLLLVALLALLSLVDPAHGAPCDLVELRLGPASELDLGWNGAGHDQPLGSGATLSLAVVRRCSASGAVCLFDGDCLSGETCDATCDCDGGPDSVCEITGPVDQKRCLVATHVPCLVDGDCPVNGGTCESFFAPPLPLSADGTPTCVTSYLTGDLTGTVDLQSGQTEAVGSLRWRVHLGITLSKPCPRCGAVAQNPQVGDTFTCDGGPRNGSPCTVAGVAQYFGGTSYDCPPDANSNVSGIGLPIRMDRLSTQPQSVDATLPCGSSLAALHPSNGGARCLDTFAPCSTNADCLRCSGAPTIACSENADCVGNGTCAAAPEQPIACGLYCHCGFCNGDPDAPCFSDAQCGAGETCQQGTGSTQQSQNNNCTDLTCGLGGFERCCDNADPSCVNPTPMVGECADQAYRGCSNNSDCTNAGAAGPCLLSNRACFENRILRTGFPSPLGSYCLAEPVPGACTTNADCSVGACTPYVMKPRLDALFCVPPTASASINAASGVPGPATISLDATMYFDGNGVACICGNGVLECTEQCEDGNAINGDGCDQNCTLTACGNGVLTPGTGELCDDGDLVSGDGCDENCTPTACGNGIVAGSELCDDGNVTSGDGCDENCRPTECGNGVVTGGTGETCDDGNVVNGDGCSSTCQIEIPSLCSLVSGCIPLGVGGRGRLHVFDKDDDSRDHLSWKWAKGGATDAADLGDPEGSTPYVLCVYDSTVLGAAYVVPPSSSKWSLGSSRALYRDKAGTEAGITAIKVRAGDSGRARVEVKARGLSLDLPPAFTPFQLFEQSPSVTVRLVNGEGVCWEADFRVSSTKKNTGNRFLASVP